MNEHDDVLYLVHIWRTARLIQQTLAVGPESIEADPNFRDATLYRLQTLAESTQKLSPEIKDRNPDIPWREIAGMRNRLVHGYHEIQMSLVLNALAEVRSLTECVQRELGVLALNSVIDKEVLLEIEQSRQSGLGDKSIGM